MEPHESGKRPFSIRLHPETFKWESVGALPGDGFRCIPRPLFHPAVESRQNPRFFALAGLEAELLWEVTSLTKIQKLTPGFIQNGPGQIPIRFLDPGPGPLVQWKVENPSRRSLVNRDHEGIAESIPIDAGNPPLNGLSDGSDGGVFRSSRLTHHTSERAIRCPSGRPIKTRWSPFGENAR